jgi:hypothetical protein
MLIVLTTVLGVKGLMIGRQYIHYSCGLGSYVFDRVLNGMEQVCRFIGVVDATFKGIINLPRSINDDGAKFGLCELFRGVFAHTFGIVEEWECSKEATGMYVAICAFN